MRVNNKRKHAHQMRANVRKRVFKHAFYNTRLRKNCACVLRVRRPLISDLYCMGYLPNKYRLEHSIAFNLILLSLPSEFERDLSKF